MRDLFYSLMTDRTDAALYRPVKFVLYLASLVYGLAIIVRSWLYKAGIFRSEKAALKVVSVGNLTLGGTGKTPFAIALARIIKSELKIEPAVLIRGYGWDEQAMLKKNLPDLPVLVGEDRAHSADRAIKLYGTSVAILDDGFQHWEMHRDLDIVLVDAGNPFGNGYLFPRGILREPKEALGRADIIVLTKTDKKNVDIGRLRQELTAMTGRAKILEAVHRPAHLYDHRQHKEFGLEIARGKTAVLVSSIGDPSYFEDAVRSLGVQVADHLVYPDHHDYCAKDLARIIRRASERPIDFIMTTDKDSVKFTRMGFAFGKFSVLTLMVTLEITKGKETLVAGLHSILRG